MRVDTFCPCDLFHEWSRGKEFSAGPIKNVEKTVAICFNEKFSRLPLIFPIDENRSLEGVVVIEIMRSELEVPFQFSGIRINRKQRRREEIVSRADDPVVVW